VATTATTWGVGDYAAMAWRLMPVAEALAERAAVREGQRVVDLACGTGNAAIAAARRGGQVVAVDLEPALLTLARQRDPHGHIDWRVGDVSALELASETFDVVLSAFGVMYALDQQAASRELARVCRPRARIALTAWTPGSSMPEMGRVLAPYLPAPTAGGGPPSRWGDADAAEALLAPHGIAVTETSRHTVTLEFADHDDAVGFLVRTAGHVVRQRPRLEREGRWAPLLADLRQLVGDRAAGRGDGIALALEYLLLLGEQRRA